jgi:hypothetical protein
MKGLSAGAAPAGPPAVTTRKEGRVTDDLPAKLQGLPGDADLGGALAGLTGGAGGPGEIDPGGVGDGLGRLVGGDGKG